KFRNDAVPRTVDVGWDTGYAMSKGARDKWISMPESMLAYYGARVWARRHCPDIILGAYTPEEILEDELGARSVGAKDITPPTSEERVGKLQQLEEAMRKARETVPVVHGEPEPDFGVNQEAVDAET